MLFSWLVRKRQSLLSTVLLQKGNVYTFVMRMWTQISIHLSWYSMDATEGILGLIWANCIVWMCVGVCLCACVRANLKLNILLRIPFQQHRKYVQYNAKLIDYRFACSSFYKSVIHRWMRGRLLFLKLLPLSWHRFSKWSSFRIVFLILIRVLYFLRTSIQETWYHKIF